MLDGTTAGDSAAAVRRLVPDHDGPGVERRLVPDRIGAADLADVDDLDDRDVADVADVADVPAGLLVAVDERWLVRWLPGPVAPADITPLVRLRDGGFAHMPRFVGAVVDDRGVVALVHELVASATDGWRWYVDDVIRWIDAGSPADGLEPLAATAAWMGSIAAELHLALAPREPVLGPISPVVAQAQQVRAVAVRHTSGDAGSRLAARLDRIDAVLAELVALDEVVIQPIHGDLHAGRFLRDGERLLVADLDGAPTSPSSASLSATPAARPLMQPVECDVAALVQSLDHVGRVAARRRPGADVEPFIAAAIDACFAGYRAAHDLDDRLLWPLRVARELHELARAATQQPAWTDVADAALARLLP